MAQESRTPTAATHAMDGLTPQLRALVDAQVFTGFALVTLQGVVGEVVGPLAQDLKPGSLEGSNLEAAQQFLRIFNTAEPTTDSLVVAGVKLLVVSQDEGRLVAVGPKREVNLVAEQLSTGVVLVVTWGRRIFPNQALCEVETVLAKAGVGAPGRLVAARAEALAAPPPSPPLTLASA